LAGQVLGTAGVLRGALTFGQWNLTG
jgi:hypothetical protein